MDTLCFLNKEFSEISNVGYVNGYILDSTDGERNYCEDFGGEGLKECYNCNGRGKSDCDNCNSGKVTCDICDGDRVDSNGDECSECEGSGRLECSECGGSGTEQCNDCDGIGEIKCGDCVGVLNN